MEAVKGPALADGGCERPGDGPYRLAPAPGAHGAALRGTVGAELVCIECSGEDAARAHRHAAAEPLRSRRRRVRASAGKATARVSVSPHNVTRSQPARLCGRVECLVVPHRCGRAVGLPAVRALRQLSRSHTVYASGAFEGLQAKSLPRDRAASAVVCGAGCRRVCRVGAARQVGAARRRRAQRAAAVGEPSRRAQHVRARRAGQAHATRAPVALHARARYHGALHATPCARRRLGDWLPRRRVALQVYLALGEWGSALLLLAHLDRTILAVHLVRRPPPLLRRCCCAALV